MIYIVFYLFVILLVNVDKAQFHILQIIEERELRTSILFNEPLHSKASFINSKYYKG